MKVYEYKACSTCVKALKWLDKQGIAVERVPIVDQPPSLKELRAMLAAVKARGGSIKNLFNTSGVQYRELGIADQIKNGLDESGALTMLSKNGKLIKRPFVPELGVVGFKEDDWKKLI